MQRTTNETKTSITERIGIKDKTLKTVKTPTEG